MAPRQLRLEPSEVDLTADKGVKRVRADSTEECSTQARDVSAARTPLGAAAPSLTITAKAVHYNTLRGFSNFNPIPDSFVKFLKSTFRLNSPEHSNNHLLYASDSALKHRSIRTHCSLASWRRPRSPSDLHVAF
eukprot:scaffold5571_cov142-Isochrysis_galbana.AAC.9